MKANLSSSALPHRRGMAALAAVSLFFSAGGQPSALAQPTSVFTYSGRMMQSNAPADGLSQRQGGFPPGGPASGT